MKDILSQVARDHGTPCYVYLMDQVRERVALVRAAFGNRFHVSYAVKANPNPGLLRRLRGVVDGLDVSSAGEVSRAIAAGWEPAELGFTGPGKTRDELQAAVDHGLGQVIVESLDEAELLAGIAERAQRRQRVLVRVTPTKVPRGFGLNMSGKPTQFGIDEEDLDVALRQITRLPHLEVGGLHIYSGTQCLNAAAIAENLQIFIEIFRRVCHAHDLTPQLLVFGSGIGIPYYEGDAPVDLAAVTDAVNPSLDALKAEPRFAATVLALETGRYLVGEAGYYLTSVIRTKRSRGTDIAICDGGMNHHLAATGHFGSIVRRNYRMFKVTGDDHGAGERAYDLVGPLCTTIDTLARQVAVGRLEAGDVIAVRGSGAYGLTASPVYFISHGPPREILVETVGGRVSTEDVSLLRPTETSEAKG